MSIKYGIAYDKHTQIAVVYNKSITPTDLISASPRTNNDTIDKLVQTWIDKCGLSQEINNAYNYYGNMPGLHNYEIYGYVYFRGNDDPTTIFFNTHVSNFSVDKTTIASMAYTEVTYPNDLVAKPKLLNTLYTPSIGVRSTYCITKDIQRAVEHTKLKEFLQTVLDTTPNLNTCLEQDKMKHLSGNLISNKAGDIFAVLPEYSTTEKKSSSGRFRKVYSNDIPKLATPYGWSVIHTEKLGPVGAARAVMTGDLKKLIKATGIPLTGARISGAWSWKNPALMADIARGALKADMGLDR